jgi:hypothetical protein
MVTSPRSSECLINLRGFRMNQKCFMETYTVAPQVAGLWVEPRVSTYDTRENNLA